MVGSAHNNHSVSHVKFCDEIPKSCTHVSRLPCVGVCSDRGAKKKVQSETLQVDPEGISELKESVEVSV